MTGFFHEFKRNYNTLDDNTLVTAVHLGAIEPSLHVDPSTAEFSLDRAALGALDAAALRVPCPGKSDVRAPVDGVYVLLLSAAVVCGTNLSHGKVLNKRCQEWTMEYVQLLVSLGYLDHGAIQLVQDQRDPPTHGVMLRRGGDGDDGTE